jgi:hypothetical protein
MSEVFLASYVSEVEASFALCKRASEFSHTQGQFRQWRPNGVQRLYPPILRAERVPPREKEGQELPSRSDILPLMCEDWMK